MSWWGFREYVPVSKKKQDAKKKLAKLKKDNPDLQPVHIEGRKIANTWWGSSWCKNLESYADYRNRIGRGSAYVKNGFVLDLQIDQGVIEGKVQGTMLYDINIHIDKLDDKNRERLIAAIGHKINNVEDLLSGNFPKEFGELFLTQQKGLFPSPKEIHLDCDCPDWADMCKHVAAVLYGVGARLDKDPLLFFKLRGIDVGDFIKKSIDEKLQNMMKNAGSVTKRVIRDDDIADIFHTVQFTQGAPVEGRSAAPARKDSSSKVRVPKDRVSKAKVSSSAKSGKDGVRSRAKKK